MDFFLCRRILGFFFPRKQEFRYFFNILIFRLRFVPFQIFAIIIPKINQKQFMLFENRKILLTFICHQNRELVLISLPKYYRPSSALFFDKNLMLNTLFQTRKHIRNFFVHLKFVTCHIFQITLITKMHHL